MAVRFDYWFDTDLNKPVQIHNLGMIGQQDSSAVRVGFRAFRDGQKVALSGTVRGYVIRSDGAIYTVSGSITSGSAYIDLSSACQNVAGEIQITIKVNDMTVGCVRGYVTRTHTSNTITG